MKRQSGDRTVKVAEFGSSGVAGWPPPSSPFSGHHPLISVNGHSPEHPSLIRLILAGHLRNALSSMGTLPEQVTAATG